MWLCCWYESLCDARWRSTLSYWMLVIPYLVQSVEVKLLGRAYGKLTSEAGHRCEAQIDEGLREDWHQQGHVATDVWADEQVDSDSCRTDNCGHHLKNHSQGYTNPHLSCKVTKTWINSNFGITLCSRPQCSRPACLQDSSMCGHGKWQIVCTFRPIYSN